MIDHVGFAVADFAKSRAFYVAALAPLGIVPVLDVTREESGDYEGTGFGFDGKPILWIGGAAHASGPAHVAFASKTRDAVDRFYTAAIEAGGRDNGKPGLRTDYGPNYYAAFVVDPDGYRMEAYCGAAK